MSWVILPVEKNSGFKDGGQVLKGRWQPIWGKMVDQSDAKPGTKKTQELRRSWVGIPVRAKIFPQNITYLEELHTVLTQNTRTS